MGFYRGVNFVTSGLLLALDAANTKSYPGSGTAWNDLSGNGNNGTLTNGPTFNSANGGSIVFDGIDDYVNVVPPSITGSKISISLWYYKSSTPSAYALNARNTLGGREYSFHIPWSDGTIYWDCGNNGNNDTVTNFDRISKPAVPSDYLGWHNWVFWKDASIGTMKIYKDGIEWYSTGTTLTKVIGQASALNIARGTLGDFPDNASISNLQIYNRTLSAQEIQQNYNAQKSRFGL
jgi:hypothetical protein